MNFWQVTFVDVIGYILTIVATAITVKQVKMELDKDGRCEMSFLNF